MTRDTKGYKKALIMAVGPVAFAAAGIALYRAFRLLSIGAAYKAKILCSGIFVSHRTPESILNCDLVADNLGILRYIGATIDYDSKEVAASVFGLIKRKAVFKPGLGCSLCYDSDSPPFIALAQAEVDPPAAPMAIPEEFDARLDPVLDMAFSEPDQTRLRRTRAVAILHRGRLVAERYAPGFSVETPLPGWSMTKAVINALAGILVKEGRLSLDATVPVPEWRDPDDPRGRITLDHLLRMSSGMRFHEDYGNPLQDVTRMLFEEPDAAAYAARKALGAEPGTGWSYSSGTTNIISRIIRTTLGDDDYLTFPRRALFTPLGMSSAVMEADASGTFVGSSFMYATARDWAKFGQLYLQEGVWEGERILPEGWVKYSTTPAPQAPGREYGAHMWLKIASDFSSRNQGSLVPADTFHASGHEGQFVSIIPSGNLVIVRLGLTRYPSTWLHDVFIGMVLKALEN